MRMIRNIFNSFVGALIAALLLLFSAGETHAQAPWNLVLEGTVSSQDDKKRLDGAKIDIKKNGSNFRQVTTGPKGDFEISLPPNAKYMLIFSYDGHVSKRIAFNTSNVPPEMTEGGDFLFRFDMSLFREREGLDVSILSKPLAEIKFEGDAQDFTYDKAYTKSVQAQMDKLRSDLEAMEEEYEDAMSDGDKAMSKGEYSLAKTYFAAALAVKKGDEAAQSKLDDAQKKYAKAREEKEKEDAYNEAIEMAEMALSDDDLKEAEANFELALDAKPGDLYAKGELKKIRDNLANEAKAEQAYITAIGKADAALAVNDYLTAKAEYTKANEAKPSDEYAKGQLAHVEDLLLADAKKESDYIKAIERGESSLENKDYEAAKAAFTQASEIKPDEKYPKQQLTEIETLLAEIALLNKGYDEAIKQGDAALAREEYDAAKKSYEDALGLKPDQKYPQEQIALINDKVAEMDRLAKEYDELIKDADARFDSKDYVAAKAEYQKALDIKPNESHPAARIDEITKILEKEHQIEEDYKAAIANADGAFNAKDYNSAKFEYEAASKLKPDESYPKEQIAKCDEFLADAAKLEEDYKNAIAEGDAKMQSEDFEAAKTSYTAALALKPDEEYPKKQLDIIDEKLVALANLNKEYDAAIAEADKQYDAGELEGAKENYQKALDMKPSEEYPKERIAAITTALADAQKKEEEYQNFIAEADGALGNKEYDAAMAAYKSASGLKPDEKYPQEKIAEIEKITADLAETQKAYDEAIAKADEAFNANELEKALPLYQEAAGIKEGESYPVEQITLIEGKLEDLKKQDENYAAAIAAAEAAEKGGDLGTALGEFKKASDIKPDEEYPKEKIDAIGALMAENEKNDKAYAEAIALADQARDGEEYDIAMTQYQKASDIKPDEEYPKEQLKKVEELKAASLAAIALAQKQDEDYNKLVGEGDALFAEQKYEDSKKKYQEALDVKPTEEYPKTKIAEIDKAMASLMAQQEKDEAYAEHISVADKAFKSKDWETAKLNYKEAQAVKPEESYPGDQLLAIETAIAEEAALASQAAKDEKYATAIAAGDQAFKSEDWETAKSSYNEAKSVKPEETYPDEQLKAIDEAIAAAGALAAKEAAEAAAKEKQAKYDAAIATADKAFKAEDWETAKASYNEAKSVKPEETYPDEQLKAIDEAIAAAGALAAKEAADAAAKEKQAKYDAAIAAADKAFKAEDWETAKSSYNEAKSVKPEETYPDEQLKAIDEAIAAAGALAAKEAAEAAAKEKQAKYDAAISTGDKAFKAKDWETAKSSYNEAKSVKPEETYPDEQLRAIDEAIAAASALAAKEAAEAAAKKKEEQYQSFIGAADKAFAKKEWDNAISNYQQASNVKPEESYPKEQIKLAQGELAAANEKETEEKYAAFISTADRAFKSEDWTSAKTNYNSALSVKPNEVYPKDQIKRIDEAIAKEQAIALENQNDESYNQAIGDADQLYKNKEWQASKSKYQEALDYKPQESYPKERIAIIDKKLNAMADDAKKDAQYEALIAEADASFDNEDYKAAKRKYQEALAIKTAPHPKNRIAEIDEMEGAKAAAALAAQRAADQKKAQFNSLVAAGDKEFSAKNYDNAKLKYQQALGVKPGAPYPKKKIDEIEDILSKDQDVVVATTPKKEASGMSDEEIAAMMLAWQAERDKAKVERMDQYKSDVKETSDDRIQNADDRRDEAANDIKDLESDIAASNKAGKDRNLEEAALVEEFRQDQQKYQGDLNKDADDSRQVVYADIEENQEGQRKMKEEGNELYKINTEKSTTEKIEQIETQRERNEDAYAGVIVASESLVELEGDLRDDRENSKEHYMQDVERIQRENEMVVATVQTWKGDNEEARMDAYDDIVQLENDIHEFNSDNAESYMENTKKYNEQVEELSEYRGDKNQEAEESRTKAYNDIEDYTKEVGELTEERHNRYDKHNEEIRREGEAIIDQEAQRVADADERRMQFDRDFYTGEKKPRYPELAREYSQGVTEETYQEDEAFVVKRIVVTGENIDEYKKIYYKWGGIFYQKNGRDITETVWNTETE